MKEKDFYQISLKLFLKNERGETLILKALNNDSFAGFHDLPGGRIDTDEFRTDYSEVIKRELQEELGDIEVTIKNKPVALGRHQSVKLNASGKHFHVLYIVFEAEYHGGDIVISPEHLGFKWVDLEKIKPEEFFTSGILESIKMYLNKN